MTGTNERGAIGFAGKILERHLLLPNAWDAASAGVFEHAGFPAIGTTSGGTANDRGLLDGEVTGPGHRSGACVVC